MIFASNFNRWAGPNNPLLDLLNFMYNKLGTDLILVTHKATFEPTFSKRMGFPVASVLRGSSPSWLTRISYASFNVYLIQKMIKSSNTPSERIFVNAGIDLLFEVSCAARTKVFTGYNVLMNDENSAMFNFLDRVAVRTSIGNIVAHTQYQKYKYMSLGIDEKSIAVIPHCIDVQRVEETAEQDNSIDFASADRPIIFYGGRLIVEKGVRELVECYEHISKELPATLVLVGDGPLKDWIRYKKSKIDGCSKQGKLVFLEGWQPADALLSMMRASDIVVLPSYHEMCPILLLEAMCLGKSIVTTRLGGPAEMIADGINGLLVNPHRKDELEKSLIRLIVDAKFRRELGNNALTALREKYDVSVVAPRFNRLLDGD